MFCNKSILVQSNLATEQLKYKTFQDEFLSQARWNIAIASVAFESNKTLNFPCFITCNFVTDKLINDRSELVSYEQPLCSFFFDTKPNSSKKLVRQGKELFTLTNFYLLCPSLSLSSLFSLSLSHTFLSLSLLFLSLSVFSLSYLFSFSSLSLSLSLLSLLCY